MAGRRGHGEGSIYQADGRWRATVDLSWEGGKRKRKYLNGRTRAEVAAKLRQAQSAVSEGMPVPDDRMTVGQWLDTWLGQVIPGQRAEGTIDTYRSTVERQIRPRLGAVRLAQLKPQRIKKWHRELEGDGLAPRTIRRAHATLSAALSEAERWEIIPRNVTRLVSPPPAGEPKQDDVLTPDECRRLLEAIEGDRLEALVAVALALGLRRGEVLGLRWEDIDLENGTLSVRHSLARRKGRGLVLEAVKTARSRRTIALPEVCSKALRDHHRRQSEERLSVGSRWENSGFVFTDHFGRPIEPVVYRREFRRLCGLAEIPTRRIHALRHSSASLLLAQGVPLAVISRVLGHAGYSVTADVYLSQSDELRRDAASAIDRALTP